MWNNISKSSADHNNSHSSNGGHLQWTFKAMSTKVQSAIIRQNSTCLFLYYSRFSFHITLACSSEMQTKDHHFHCFLHLDSSKQWQSEVGRTFASMWAMICVLMSLPLKWILMIFMCTVWILLFSLLILKKDMRSSGVGSSLDVWLSISSEWLEWWVLRMLELLHNKECG